MTAYFITGTDTDVGKTWVTLGFIHAFQQQGIRSNGMKPVAAGCQWQQNQWQNNDALAIQRISDGSAPYQHINPYAFEPAIAPHIAANATDTSVQFDTIMQSFEVLSTEAEVTIVEGAGGWQVPLNDQHDLSDLAKHLNIPVILVVGMRLGCLNHAILSYDAIIEKGLPIAGWVANQVDPKMAHQQENVQTLTTRFQAPCLGKIPYLSDMTIEQVAAYLTLPARLPERN